MIDQVFGDWGNADFAEDKLAIETPTGAGCAACNETIVTGDAGAMLDGRPIHRECMMLGLFGHQVGLCSCTEFGGMDLRQAAIEASRRLLMGPCSRGSA